MRCHMNNIEYDFKYSATGGLTTSNLGCVRSWRTLISFEENTNLVNFIIHIISCLETIHQQCLFSTDTELMLMNSHTIRSEILCFDLVAYYPISSRMPARFLSETTTAEYLSEFWYPADPNQNIFRFQN